MPMKFIPSCSFFQKICAIVVLAERLWFNSTLISLFSPDYTQGDPGEFLKAFMLHSFSICLQVDGPRKSWHPFL